jgi:hypothetical protein
VAGHLAPFLGPLNAKVAVKTFAQRTLGIAPESLGLEHVPALLDGLRPMLHTFVGKASTDALLDAIRREVR